MNVTAWIQVDAVFPIDELYEEDLSVAGIYEYNLDISDMPVWQLYDKILDIFHSENAIAQLDAFEFIVQALIPSEEKDKRIGLQSSTDWLIQLEQTPEPQRAQVIEEFLEQNTRPQDKVSWLRELIYGACELLAWQEVEWSRRSLWLESWLRQSPRDFGILWNEQVTDKDRLDVLQSKLHLHIKEQLWSILNPLAKQQLLEHPDSLTCLVHDCPYLPEIKTHSRLDNIVHQLDTIKTLLNTTELNADVLALMVHHAVDPSGPSDFDFSMED